MKERIEYIDALKFFAMFMVLWGHSIQSLNTDIEPFQNFVYSHIYSFHMILFFVLSGFFFKSSLRLSVKDFFKKKGVQLLLPYISCYSLTFLVIFIINWGGSGFFWFIRELFISYTLSYLGYMILKKGYLIAIVAILYALFPPFMPMQSFYLLVFLFGIFLRENFYYFKKYNTIFLLISLAVFLLGSLYWQGEYCRSNLKIFSFNGLFFYFNEFYRGIFRLLIGVSGSVFLISFSQQFYKDNRITRFLSAYGRYTLEVYILQVWILEMLLSKILNIYEINIGVYNFLITPVVSVFVYLVCVYIYKILSRNKVIDLVFFGHRKA